MGCESEGESVKGDCWGSGVLSGWVWLTGCVIDLLYRTHGSKRYRDEEQQGGEGEGARDPDAVSVLPAETGQGADGGGEWFVWGFSFLPFSPPIACYCHCLLVWCNTSRLNEWILRMVDVAKALNVRPDPLQGYKRKWKWKWGVVGMESESESEDEGDVRGRARRKWVGEELDSEGDEV